MATNPKISDAQEALNASGPTDDACRSGSAHARPNGHSATLEEIWRSHAEQMLCITRRITKNREDAEDALQDSFLRAHVHLHSFDGRSSITTWLTRIAINSALMILRKRANAPQLSIDGGTGSGEEHAVNPTDQSASPEEQYRQLEEQERVRSAVGTLRPTIRKALELQALEERSVKEVAETMGLSISATKARIFQAKTALRRSLAAKVSRRSRRTKQFQLSPA